MDGRTSAHVGGSPANVAIGLAALGHKSHLTAHLARDEHGTLVADHLAAAGVTLTEGSLTAARTPTATATLDAEGAATYDFDLSWHVGPQDLTGIGHLHTGSIAATVEPGASEVLELMSRARASATVSYDPNCRPGIMGAPGEVRSRIEECIGRSDVVKASIEDIRWLYDDADLARVAHLWGLLGPELVVVTLGGEGGVAFLSRSGEQLTVPVHPTRVVDTVGAGDSFMAGLLSGLLDAGLLGRADSRDRLRRAAPEQVRGALDRAASTAAWTVARAGAAAPTRSDLEGPAGLR